MKMKTRSQIKTTPGAASRRGLTRPGVIGITSNTTQKEHLMTQPGATLHFSKQAAGKNAIRAFHVNIPEAELTELRRRIKATKWPERETVTDASQGIQLATIQELARYWGTKYDWRRCEAQLNALPQFITEIDEL